MTPLPRGTNDREGTVAPDPSASRWRIGVYVEKTAEGWEARWWGSGPKPHRYTGFRTADAAWQVAKADLEARGFEAVA